MKLLPLIDAYEPLLNRMLKESNGIEYSFLFLEPNLKEPSVNVGLEMLDQMRKVYLLGILERCHLACITSIARNLRWLESTREMIKTRNALGFSASLRGFLESSADSHDVMAFLPKTLDKMFKYLYLVMIDSKNVGNLWVTAGELEKKLIHFAYARRQPKGVKALPDHNNKSNADYIDSIQKFGANSAANLYSELCQLTHPAAPSVSCFLDEQQDLIRLNFNKDFDVIDDLCERYEETISHLAQFSINPALMGLCYLHRLVDDWPAPRDKEMDGVGNFSDRFSIIDQFVDGYVEGTVDRVALSKELQ